MNKLKQKFKSFFKWLWQQLKDWRTLILFIIVFIVMSASVWIWYVLGFILNNAWFYGVGSAVWLFWAGPFTPFIPLCIAITFGIKKLYLVLKERKKRHERKK